MEIERLKKQDARERQREKQKREKEKKGERKDKKKEVGRDGGGKKLYDTVRNLFESFKMPQ